jgi:hypothetical protein
LDCGSFEIAACDFSGPPDKLSIKAVSTPLASSMRREEKCRPYENTTLEQIAQTIADDAGFTLMYEVDSDIQLDRVDQLQEADLPFLQRLCNNYGVSLKVTNRLVVLFEESVYEQLDVVDTFHKDEIGNRIIKYSCRQDTSSTANSVTVSYKDPKSGKLVKADFTPSEPPETEQRLVLNIRPGDLSGDNFRDGNPGPDGGSADGTFDTGFKAFNHTADDFMDIRADATPNMVRLAKSALRDKNKREWCISVDMVGNVRMVGGVTFNWEGFGVYDGKYIVDTATHKVNGDGGYTTSVSAHSVLTGY